MIVDIRTGDCRDLLRAMPDQSIHCCVTSPPYFGLRDYGCDGQMGLEKTPEDFVAGMVEVFREVRRVLRDDGTLWINLGDSYAGAGPSGASYQSETTIRRAGQVQDGKFRISKTLEARGLSYADKKPIPPPGFKKKDLLGIPWRVAFALQADGWYLRQDIIWAKPNPMPESVRDRCTKSHEYIFLLSKREKYFFDGEAIKEPAVGGQSGAAASFKRTGSKRAVAHPGQVVGTHRPDRPDVTYDGETRNRRSVWTVSTKPFKGAHFATFPPDLIEPCILAGCPEGGVVLDPFGGAGTTGLVAQRHRRNAILLELNPEYAAMARRRIDAEAPAPTEMDDLFGDLPSPDALSLFSV